MSVFVYSMLHANVLSNSLHVEEVPEPQSRLPVFSGLPKLHHTAVPGSKSTSFLT